MVSQTIITGGNIEKAGGEMRPIKLRNIVIGQGAPKICVPVVGKTAGEIEREAREAVRHEIDMVEWRADWFDGVKEEEQVLGVLRTLREILGEVPLLFTIRTRAEGGEGELTEEEYEKITALAAASGLADMIDVELYSSPAERLVKKAHENQVKVIMSNHEFHRTPEKSEMIARLLKMQELDADVLKIAVMPLCKKDVIELLSATEEMTEVLADRPVVTMSMGQVGCVSRLVGEVFGSAITFGAVTRTSAPGQIPVEELRSVLGIIHNYSGKEE